MCHFTTLAIFFRAKEKTSREERFFLKWEKKDYARFFFVAFFLEVFFAAFEVIGNRCANHDQANVPLFLKTHSLFLFHRALTSIMIHKKTITIFFSSKLWKTIFSF